MILACFSVINSIFSIAACRGVSVARRMCILVDFHHGIHKQLEGYRAECVGAYRSAEVACGFASMSGGAGAGAVVRHGYLRKLKTMKRKYFVLRAETHDCSARLEYYETEKKFRSGVTPRRVIPLKSCFNITRRLDLKQRHVIALYTKEEQFCVVAEGEEDLHKWLTDLLKQHQSDDASEELLHPTQHVWQVNVQKRGLGASKSIIGLYNLCLTDKTLTLVKIKSNNNFLGELCVPAERIEFSLRNIRRCGDSECFFYMEVGRQTVTGAGELWMHTDDANIAQSMHTTIYHAMSNCREESFRNRSSSATEDPRNNSLPARRQTFSDSRGRGHLGSNENKALCVGSCLKPCVCPTETITIEDTAASPASVATPNNAADDNYEKENRAIKHHRTISLPTGCPLFQEPLKIVHERTRSAPLTGDELDHAIIEKAARHNSCKAVNGNDKKQWNRRASTGTKLYKLSPAHNKNGSMVRSRCDSMPSRPTRVEPEGLKSRTNSDTVDGMLDSSREEEAWRAARIPEEPDYLEMTPRSHSHASSAQHSRQSSLAGDAASPPHRHLSEFLEPAISHVIEEEFRPPRAYSVGSRPAAAAAAADCPRLRAYSVGGRAPPRRPATHAPPPRASAGDLMELDFSNNSPRAAAAATAAIHTPHRRARPKLDEYVDMSPRSEYVEMRPSDISNVSAVSGAIPIPRSPPVRMAASKSPPTAVATTPDGYVEMNYGKRSEERTPSRPISINAERRPFTSTPIHTPEDFARKKRNGPSTTPMGSQTLFPMSLESPASPPEKVEESEATDAFDEESMHHPLSTVREISEEGRRSPEVGSPPHYVTLVSRAASAPIAAPAGGKAAAAAAAAAAGEGAELSRNPTATKTWAGSRSSPPPPPPGDVAALNYAALDLEPTGGKTNNAPTTYTKIDFCRSEKLNTSDN